MDTRNELLALAVDGHGGLRRWHRISRFGASVSIVGAIWEQRGKPGLLADVALEGETRDQRLKISPYPWPGRYTTWEPYRQTLETADGMLVAERRDPESAFTGFTQHSPWDDFQVAYFAGQASWNYFVAPFLFARPDFAVEEGEPWAEDGEVWRRLVVVFPPSIVAHSRRQTYYFDDRGLLRRHDYTVDLLGGGPTVHYPSDYREFDGIMVATRRRVYVRHPDGTPARDALTVAIDVTDAAFS
jgi:hypothetical protein